MFDDPSLLVVDDEKAICEGCRRIFSRQGFRVDQSNDPHQGLSMAERENYAAILLDIKMPAMDGVRFLEKLRGRKPDVPVIFITGYPSVSNAASAVRLGASDYVTKPFTPEQITQAVQRVLSQRPAEAEEEAGSAWPEAEPWLPRAGEFRFFDESWFQLGEEGWARAGAMHQRMPDVPMAFEGAVRVGAMAAPSEGAGVEAIRLPRVGEAVYQGLPLAGLIVAGRPQRVIPSPISGVVVSVNVRLRQDLAALWESPCGNGWIASVSPTRFEEDVRNCRLRRVLLANADETSARRVREQLMALGCHVQVVGDWEAMEPALKHPARDLLVLDAASFGEQGPEVVGRVNAAAPEMRIVVLAAPDARWEAAYRRHRILYYAVEPFADNEIAEILNTVFRPQRQFVAEPGQPKSVADFVSSISITNRRGKKVCLLASSRLLRKDHGLGWLIRRRLLEHSYPVETLLGTGTINWVRISDTASTCDRLLLLLARDTGRLPGSLTQDTSGEFIPVTGNNIGKVMGLVVQPHSPAKGLAGLDERITAALAEYIVHEMASC